MIYVPSLRKTILSEIHIFANAVHSIVVHNTYNKNRKSNGRITLEGCVPFR